MSIGQRNIYRVDYMSFVSTPILTFQIKSSLNHYLERFLEYSKTSDQFLNKLETIDDNNLLTLKIEMEESFSLYSPHATHLF